MDKRFENLGFTSDQPGNAFKMLGNSMQVPIGGANYDGDTILQFDSASSSIAYTSSSKGTKRKSNLIDGSCMCQGVCTTLSHGLGISTTCLHSKGSSVTACTILSSTEHIDEESSMNVKRQKKPTSSSLKMLDLNPNVDLELSLSIRPSNSNITSKNVCSSPPPLSLELPEFSSWPQNANEVPLSNTSLVACNSSLINPIVPDLSSTRPKDSGIKQQRRGNNYKSCEVEGCKKAARGGTRRCVSHGGGKRCQKAGCNKGAEGNTVYCKGHGGGRRCEYLGCIKSAEGRTNFCIAHGGGKRCKHEGCTTTARGKAGLCIKHGGGRRCQRENCNKSAEGQPGFCIAHGGGRRCQKLGCTKGAQGSTNFCKAHGGGKRCTSQGCTKGAEGSTPFCKAHGGGKRCRYQGGGVCPKSVHGGTNFCVAHGGGKRCLIPNCTKSARGRTDYCVRHGGGKRCTFEGCGKSAQGSTDFCKKHGGGKRCSRGHPGSACNSKAMGKGDMCALDSGSMQQGKTSHEENELEHVVTAKGMIMDGRVHGGSFMTMLA